ncbi:hypothetical protein QVD17_31517 [Tagetes erecta]|uniref:Uncharacterized protein n=1 Tax=Tagetes erecta TaxID=13708 RepID=A0AAD8K3Y4_TARER|nr:hypothetical protein QVD17_31517 [Tagetes erecta]
MDLSLPSSDIDRPDECIDQSIETISSRFNHKLQLEECDADNNHEQDEEQNENEDDDDDFTFMLIGDDEPSTGVDKVFENDQIRPVFPLFDQKLLLEGEFDVEEIDRLQIHPPVDRIFIQSEHDEKHDVTIGPYCDWSKQYSATATAELSKKSNSTGFSKLWRLKEKVGRSNSDGRDAFVFLKHHPKKMETTTSSSSSSTGDEKFVKVSVSGVVKQKTKVKKATVSAHEVYLKSRGGHTEEERRRSYLPYRPELMGFFTNVHGGLTKNVHPY